MPIIIKTHQDPSAGRGFAALDKNLIQLRLLCLLSCALVPAIPGTAFANSSPEKQSIADKAQYELVKCTLPRLLGDRFRESADTGSGQTSSTDRTANFKNPICRELYQSAYKAEDNASYAMGVYLMREVLKDYEEVDWADLMNGVVRASGSGVHVNATGLEAFLRDTLLDETERSDQYMRQFANAKNVEEVSGVYFRKMPGDGLDIEMAASTCENENSSKEPTHKWMYVQVKPIDESDPAVPAEIPCISFTEADVIRGWRMIADELEGKQADDDRPTYDVLIPSEFAYGDEGNGSSVEAGENLRFIIRAMALAE